MATPRTAPFRGTAPALVTPFTAEGSIDKAAYQRLIDYQIGGSALSGGRSQAGVEALVTLGTTGENPTVSDTERNRLVDLTIEHCNGRVPVVVGSGTNDTAQSIFYSREAAAAGADALLVVSPYYNKPTPEGLLAHLSAIADAADCPIILYNVPGRTGSNISAEVTLMLADEVPTLVGVKEASGNLNQIVDIIAHRPEGFAVYSGDDDLAFATACLGGDGLISVIANAVPGAISEMVRQALAGHVDAARALHYEILDAMRATFIEANPGPIKAVLAAMGRLENVLRLPLVPLSDFAQPAVHAAYAPFIDANTITA